MKRAALYIRVSSEKQAKRTRESEGYSIPAQREECLRYAASIDAQMIVEFIDVDTGRRGDRDGILDLVDRIQTAGDLDVVIVHKVDRFGRNLEEHYKLRNLLRRHQVEFASATENVDETPSGRLVEGIMALLAEHYSINLGLEVIKGMAQKAKAGGTVSKARLGYRNVRKVVDGREIRTVELDPDRAPLVRDGFTQFAAGEHTVKTLLAYLTERGLRTRPGTRHPAGKPLTPAGLNYLLRSRYYLGYVTYNGVEYKGAHEPLIDADTFDRVQLVLDSHTGSGEKRQKHHHYLKGVVYCGRCEARMSLMRVKGNGGVYDYFYCLGRKMGNNCNQPYVWPDVLEGEVERFYRFVELAPTFAAELHQRLTDELAVERERHTRTLAQQQTRLDQLDAEERKLLGLYYRDHLTEAIFAEEQARIARERREATKILQAAADHYADGERALRQALDLATDCQTAYTQAGSTVRQLLNRTFFTRIYVDGDTVTRAELAAPFRQLHALQPTDTTSLPSIGTTPARHPAGEDRADPGGDDDPGEVQDQQTGVLAGTGSKMTTMVGDTGIEPVTSTVSR